MKEILYPLLTAHRFVFPRSHVTFCYKYVCVYIINAIIMHSLHKMHEVNTGEVVSLRLCVSAPKLLKEYRLCNAGDESRLKVVRGI
jgi:hypothetical protein